MAVIMNDIHANFEQRCRPYICATATSPLSFAIPQELLNLSTMDVRPDDSIQAYLKTGEHDPMFFAWPQNGVLDKSRIGTAHLRDALIAATALHHDMTVITRNTSDFDRFDKLTVTNPWT